MKVLISQPMAGVPDRELKKRFDNMVEKFKKLHIEVVNNLFSEEPSAEYYVKPIFYLHQSIDLIGKVDAVYFAPGWNRARGCIVERHICELYGIKCLESEFLNDVEVEDNGNN